MCKNSIYPKLPVCDLFSMQIPISSGPNITSMFYWKVVWMHIPKSSFPWHFSDGKVLLQQSRWATTCIFDIKPGGVLNSYFVLTLFKTKKQGKAMHILKDANSSCLVQLSIAFFDQGLLETCGILSRFPYKMDSHNQVQQSAIS